MKPSRFSPDEVTLLLGRRVRSPVPISVVPKGSNGCVVAAEEIEPGRFNLVVECDLARPGSPERDYFSRDEFERSLVEA